jgi:trk system potassium uptake protein TrkH
MRWRFIIHVVGILIFYIGLAMLVPIVFGVYYNDNSVVPMLESMAITMAVGILLYFVTRGATTDIMSQREGMAIVALGWTTAGLFGGLPFFFSNGDFAFTDAFF